MSFIETRVKVVLWKPRKMRFFFVKCRIIQITNFCSLYRLSYSEYQLDYRNFTETAIVRLAGSWDIASNVNVKALNCYPIRTSLLLEGRTNQRLFEEMRWCCSASTYTYICSGDSEGNLCSRVISLMALEWSLRCLININLRNERRWLKMVSLKFRKTAPWHVSCLRASFFDEESPIYTRIVHASNIRSRSRKTS